MIDQFSRTELVLGKGYKDKLKDIINKIKELCVIRSSIYCVLDIVSYGCLYDSYNVYDNMGVRQIVGNIVDNLELKNEAYKVICVVDKDKILPDDILYDILSFTFGFNDTECKYAINKRNSKRVKVRKINNS